MMCQIRDGNIAWEPSLSGGVRTAMGVASLLRLATPALMHKPLGGGTAPTTDSTIMGTMVPGVILAGGGIPGGSLSVAPQLSVATLEATPKQVKGGNEDKVPTKNQWLHQVLFGEYRAREVVRRQITSRSLRDLIKLGKIPKLPNLKVDKKEM